MKLGLKLSQTDKNYVVGGLAGTVFDMVIDYPIAAVNNNAVPALQYFDEQGRYVWGVGAGDVVTAGVGAGMYFIGKRKRNENLKGMAKGWLLAFGLIKLSEFGNYIRQVYPYTVQPLGGRTYVASTPRLATQPPAMITGAVSKYRIST